MQNVQSGRVAIVFSCDQAYAFLARGLVLSLREAGYPNKTTSVILIDIGCDVQTLSWMKDSSIEIVQFDPGLVPSRLLNLIRPAQRAQVVRPWLPQLLPQFEHLIWFDCDLWLQNGEVIKLMQTGASITPDAVTIAPGMSHYNTFLYHDIERLLTMQRSWYMGTYEPQFAGQAVNRIHYSSGVFGMLGSSPVWALWRQEVLALYPIIAVRNANLLHLAEQIALNIVIFRTNLKVNIDPLYNFHCNSGGAMRTATGRVMTNLLLPPREIGVIHLANWSLLREHYLEQKLLYQGGGYLSPAEYAALAKSPS